jgi:hypothetical protein
MPKKVLCRSCWRRLALLPAERYTIDLLQAIKLDSSRTSIMDAVGSKGRGQIGGNESNSMTAYLIVPRPLLEDAAQAVHNRFRAAAADRAGKEAASHFSFANELTDLANKKRCRC